MWLSHYILIHFLNNKLKQKLIKSCCNEKIRTISLIMFWKYDEEHTRGINYLNIENPGQKEIAPPLS